MTDTFPTSSLGYTPFAAMPRGAVGNGLRSLREAALAGVLVCLASVIASAETILQDWIPDVLTMPEDVEVTLDREIGSSVRLFALSTGADGSALIAEWEEALRTDGFAITSAQDELLEDSIEFSGPGITNAKIVAKPTADQDRIVIEFDATLR